GLCRRHHRMKQHARWRYTLEPDGVITWISPTGEKRVTLPDHTHWPPPCAEPGSAADAPTAPVAELLAGAPPF
ncbi:MAG: HNH endonuclease, partial [Ornithinibacter sp.]